jgi:hypothetical protein
VHPTQVSASLLGLPGAKFSQYDRMAVLECYVQFQKNWAREYNQDAIGPDQQVTDADIQRMKGALANESKRYSSRS